MIFKFKAYSGTTLENFLLCKIVLKDKLVFDKSRESRHLCDKVFFWPEEDKGFVNAAAYSVKVASHLNHRPLIMEGRVVSAYPPEIHADPSMKFFPVDKIYLMKDNVDPFSIGPWNEFHTNQAFYVVPLLDIISI